MRNPFIMEGILPKGVLNAQKASRYTQCIEAPHPADSANALDQPQESPSQADAGIIVQEAEGSPLVYEVQVSGLPPQGGTIVVQTNGGATQGRDVVINLTIEADFQYGQQRERLTSPLCKPAPIMLPETYGYDLDPDYALSVSEDLDELSDSNGRAAGRRQGESQQADSEQSEEAANASLWQEEPPENRQPQDEAEPKKKKKGHLGDVLFYGFLVLLVVGAFLLSGGTGGGPRMFAGFSAFTVTTGSMHDVLPQGSLIVTRQVEPETLQVGDDITYMTSETASITHRIIDIVEDYEDTDQPAFQTQGTMNKKPDSKLVPAANVVGKVVFCSYGLGMAVGFIQGNWPLLLFLVAVAAVLFTVLRRILR